MTSTTTHGRDCTPACRAQAVPSPIERDSRPPAVPCPYCGAAAGVACCVTSRPRHRLKRSHPSRLLAVVA